MPGPEGREYRLHDLPLDVVIRQEGGEYSVQVGETRLTPDEFDLMVKWVEAMIEADRKA